MQLYNNDTYTNTNVNTYLQIANCSGFKQCNLLLENVLTFAEPSTIQTTLTPPPEIGIQLEDVKAALPFSVEVNVNFSEELNDKKSPMFRQYATSARQQLTHIYNNTPGFQFIDIKQFRPGSVIIEYTVVLDGIQTQLLNESIEYMIAKVVLRLGEVCISNVCVIASIVTENMTRQLMNVLTRFNHYDLCSFIIPSCPSGYVCQMKNSKATCVDMCRSDPHLCLNGGECLVNSRDNRIKCRCLDTDSHFYSGDRCEVENMKIPDHLSTKDYAIFAGVAAAAVLVVIISVLVIRNVYKRCKNGNKEMDSRVGESHSSLAHASIRMKSMDDDWQGKSTFDNIEYIYASRRTNINRNQRVYRDPQTGEEAIIYQPTIMTGQLPRASGEIKSEQSEHFSRRPIYDIIGTNEVYKIKRPNMRESRMGPQY